MQKTAMNPNPEQDMAVNPFAQEQTAEIQPQENAQTYPVEVVGIGYKPLYDPENLKPRS